LIGWTSTVAAQAENEAAARVLFVDARRLVQSGQYEQACPKFEAASKLYAGSGVLLNLGDCFEHIGRTASAWTKFGEAASAASRLGRADDEAEAKRRQAALEPRLSRLVLRVTREAPGMVLKRDGTPLPHAAWSTGIPIDPGTHALSAEAAGRTPWSVSVTVKDPGETSVVDVPELSPVQATGVATHPEPLHELSSPYWTGRRVAGVAMVLGGAIAVAVGGALGLGAKSTYERAAQESGTARHDDSVSAVHAGNLATGVIAVGGALATAGAIVWLTAPSSPAVVATDGGQLFVRGKF
jgi:hypothetical protein